MTQGLEGGPLGGPCPGIAITDEEIMAYADGVLAPERRAVVREALANDAALMQALESFLLTRGPQVRPFDEILAAPVPDRLLEALRTPAAAAPAPARGLGALLRAATGGHLFAKLRAPMLAVAALCLVLLGAWLGDYAMRHAAPPPERQELARWEDRGLVAQPALQHALDATPSGEEARLFDRLSIKLLATLRTKEGSWCREFDLLSSNGPRGRSLACRGKDGAWLVPVTPMPQGKEYGVAGGPAAEAPPGKSQPIDEGLAMLEAARQRISSDAVVSADEEKGLIEGRWRRTP